MTRSTVWYLDSDWIRSIKGHLNNQNVELLPANKKFQVKGIVAKFMKKQHDFVAIKLSSAGKNQMINLMDNGFNHYEHTEIDGRAVILLSSIAKNAFLIIISGKTDITTDDGKKMTEKDGFGNFSKEVHNILRSNDLDNKVHFNFTNWEILKKYLKYLFGEKKDLIEQYQKRIYSEMKNFIKSDDIRSKEITSQRTRSDKEKLLEQQIKNTSKQYNGQKLGQNVKAQNFEQNYSLNHPKNQYSQSFGSSVKDALQTINQNKTVELSSSNSQDNSTYSAFKNWCPTTSFWSFLRFLK